MMRRETRLKNLLIPVKSINNIPLDYDLFHINITLAGNYENYKTNYVTKSFFGCGIKHPIFITPKDREKYHEIESKTKS